MCLSGDGLSARAPLPTTEVVVTLKAPALSAFGRSLLSASHREYAARMEAAQNALVDRVRSTIPDAVVRWRYHLVADGFAVVVPRSEVSALSRLPGVAAVWPSVTYHSLRSTASSGSPEEVGADQLWGPDLATAGNGMKIGIIDDGLDADHPYFNPSGVQYPPGFPKGQTKYTTPKVIVQRTFAPASETWKYKNVPFDPSMSFHATHVAGIAAGRNGTDANGAFISGVAPNAYLGNYKALTVPTPGDGLDGNSGEITAAIEAAVGDGMNVINLSIGEPEVEPSRDIVVKAIDAAAAAGVVPVIAAGNDFDGFGYGTVSSPANAPDAITVAATTADDVIADFSSAGPTPISLLMKPDVSAPGVSVLSSLPPSQGTWGLLSGTSMATPVVSGAAALLKERHPTWTVEEIKSALEQTGDPVHTPSGAEALTMREGGGLIDLPKADNPLLFASPTGLTFGRLAPGATATRTVTLTDAGGGAGPWTATTVAQTSIGSVAVTSPVTVPGTFTVTATAGAAPGDAAGFVVLTSGANVRRIPYWFEVSAPQLGSELRTLLTHPGIYGSTTVGGPAKISAYRYPTGGDVLYPGPERAYRVVVGNVANFGVVVLSGRAVPHVTYDGDEDHLTGYDGLPIDLNPYRSQFEQPTRTAGAVLPGPGTYDIVFDTRSAGQAGKFTFRYWVNDVTPPRLRLLSTRGSIVVSATDAGSGVDPSSILATIGGKPVKATFAAGKVHIPAAAGAHKLVLRVSDYQESKNMEDVSPVLPNTATLTATVHVRKQL